MKKPMASIETITPETAAEWLKKGKKNRKINVRRVGHLAEQMRSGRYVLSPDAVAFNDADVLFNGQHRLDACVASGVAIDCLVLRNAPQESFMVTDVGMRKTGQHALDTLGFNESKTVAAVARFIVLDELGLDPFHSGGTTVQPNQIVAVVTKSLETICKKAKSLSGREKINASPTILAYCLHLAVKAKCYYDMLDFLTRVSLGAGLTTMSPELALQRALNKIDADYHTSHINRRKCALIIKGYNAKVNKEKMERLTYRENEEFPVVLKSE